MSRAIADRDLPSIDDVRGILKHDAAPAWHPDDAPEPADLHELLDTIRCVVRGPDGFVLADMVWRHCQGERLTRAERAALRAMRRR